MKRFTFIVPLLLLSFLLFAYNYKQNESENTNQIKIKSSKSSEHPKKLSSEYFIEVSLIPQSKMLIAKQKIKWFNTTDFPTSEIQLHLYPNAFANNNTEFAKNLNLTEEEQTKISIESVEINDEKTTLEYFQPEVENPFDSTVAKITFNNQVTPGDSVEIIFDYSLKIPLSVSRFGYAAGRDFYFISQWFPKLGVFREGEWICSQYHANTEFYSDFSNYVVEISLPKDYLISATGKRVSEKTERNQKTVLFKAENVIDFALSTSPKFVRRTKVYQSKFSKEIEVEFLIQPENSELIERNFKAAFNVIEFLEENIGEYPYPKITLVDAPRTSNIGGMEYPQIVTYYTPLYAPIEIQSPEATIIHEMIHQYFYAAVSSNEVYEAWLDEGLTDYLEEKVLNEYYGRPELNFKFIDYYPVFGIQFLSFNEIPIIYTLRSLKYDQYAMDLSAYYRNNNLGNILDTSYTLPTRLSYLVNAYSKPSLVLRTLEGYIGENNVLQLLSKYYNQNKFSLVTSENLLRVLTNYDQQNLDWFIDNFIRKNEKFDYRLSYINERNDSTYIVFVERLKNGQAPVDIKLFTEEDTLKIYWEGKERWKKFEIRSKNKILAGEIDPQRKNKFDLNFANNSYTIASKYWGSWSISIRWFFWVQNALLIFGSIG